jgi:hypothetical protein
MCCCSLGHVVDPSNSADRHALITVMMVTTAVARRLRRALLDAEIDTQRATVAADNARQKVSDMEADLAKTR